MKRRLRIHRLGSEPTCGGAEISQASAQSECPFFQNRIEYYAHAENDFSPPRPASDVSHSALSTNVVEGLRAVVKTQRL